MNEDPMQELEPRAGDELDRQIGRYARVRLDPSPAQTRRARAAVMEEAWRRRLAPDLASAASTSGARATRRRRGPFASWGGRRVGTAFAAAVLAGLVLGSSAFAASRAGGPLYDARLSLEALTLPGDPTARLEAELARAQSRIAEIAEAASRGDGGALNAAVGAYASTLAAIDEVSGEPAGRARDAVILHQAVLRDLLEHVPLQAQVGIERAIDNSATAIDRLDAASAAPAATPAGPVDAGGENPNAGGENPNAGGENPNAGAGNNSGGGNQGGAGGNDGGGNQGGGGNDGGGGNQGGGGDGGNQNAGGGGNDGGGNANEDKSPRPDRSKRPNKPTVTPSD